MKIIKIFFISIAVLILVLVVSCIILIKVVDVNRFKPQIISQASNVLKRKIDFERLSLGLSLNQGLSFKVSNLVIGEDPVFGKEDFLSVREISLGIDVLGYIFQKKVSIPSVLIDSAQVRIIRKKDGSLNAATITKSDEPQQKAEDREVAAPKASQALPMPVIFISSLKLSNSKISYIDQLFDPAVTVDISDLSVLLKNISLAKPFSFEAEASVLSAQRNIKLSGKTQINLQNNEIVISELKGTTDLSQVILEMIPVSFPMTKGAVLPVSLKGKMNFKLDKMTAGANGLSTLAADVTLREGFMQFKEIASPIKDILADVKVTEKNISLDKISAGIAEGLINVSGLIDDYLVKQKFSCDIDIQNLKIQDLVAQNNAGVKAEGLAAGQLSFKGQSFSPQALSSLAGGGKISIKKAQLKDINILKTVLDKISIIPRLSDKLKEHLSDKYKQRLEQKDTALLDMDLPITVENGRLVIKDTVLGSEEFMFKGRTEIGFAGDYALEGSFLIPQGLSTNIADAVSEMEYLLNGEGQIYIPLKVSGKAGDMKFSVDLEYIGEKLLVNQAQTQIWKALDKAIGKKKTDEPTDNAQTNTAGQDSQQSGQSKEYSAEELVGSILGSILKKNK